MDIGATMLLGTLYRWIYNGIKNALHLSDQAAAWGMIVLALLSALIYNMLSGGFAGLNFSSGDPIQSLQAIAAAWAMILATAQAWFSVTKKRETK